MANLLILPMTLFLLLPGAFLRSQFPRLFRPPVLYCTPGARNLEASNVLLPCPRRSTALGRLKCERILCVLGGDCSETNVESHSEQLLLEHSIRSSDRG